MIKSLFALTAAVLIAAPALAQSEGAISGSLPNSVASPIRISPVAGASSFDTGNSVNFNNFDKGFSAGLFADFGSGALNFQTGVLTLGANQTRSEGTASVKVQNWGVPLLAKLNFSGKPHETVFVKAGAMPFQVVGGDNNAFNVMGVGGLGADIPLGHFSSLVLDASYNRLFTRNGGMTDYQGIALLAGLSFNL